jgi:hypothetical protein
MTMNNYDVYKDDNYDAHTNDNDFYTISTTTFTSITSSNTRITTSVTVMSLQSVPTLLLMLPKPKPHPQPAIHNLLQVKLPPSPSNIPINPTTINQRRAIMIPSAVDFIVLPLLGDVFYHCRHKNNDDSGSRLRGRDESFKMGHVCGWWVGII